MVLRFVLFRITNFCKVCNMALDTAASGHYAILVAVLLGQTCATSFVGQSKFTLSGSPSTVVINSTEEFTLTCSSNHSTCQNLKVDMMTISKQTTDGWTQVANISCSETGSHVSDTATISGQLESCSIAITWHSPKKDIVGVYACDVYASTNTSRPLLIQAPFIGIIYYPLPLTLQVMQLTPKQVFWPSGLYALPKLIYDDYDFDCPEKRKFNSSVDSYIQSMSASYFFLAFCESARNQVDEEFIRRPKGSYCINSHYDKDCPPGFENGEIQLSEKDVSFMASGHVGMAGSNGSVSFKFCCVNKKADGLELPNTEPFFMYKNGNSECQDVYGMTVEEKDYKYRDITKFSAQGSVPDYKYEGHNLTMYYCLYKPTEM